MASDIKMEIFAYTLFHKTWLQMGMVKTMPTILQIYGVESYKVENINKACDDLYIKAVTCRRKLFERIYLEDFIDEEARSLKSPSECFNYVIKRCDDFFGDLTVFEKMFATCAFVLEFCIRIHQYNIVDVVKFGHICWAKYFNKFTKEFYEKGGWPDLKVAAETYGGLDDFFGLFEITSFFELRRAINGYQSFINSAHYAELEKRKRKGIRASSLWIKFRIEESKNLSTEELEKENLSSEELEKENLSSEELEKENLSSEELEKENLSSEELEKENLCSEELEKENLSTYELAMENLIKEELEFENSSAEELKIEKIREVEDLLEELKEIFEIIFEKKDVSTHTKC